MTSAACYRVKLGTEATGSLSLTISELWHNTLCSHWVHNPISRVYYTQSWSTVSISRFASKKHEIYTHTEVAVTAEGGFISNQHENNHEEVFKQTLLIN